MAFFGGKDKGKNTDINEISTVIAQNNNELMTQVGRMFEDKLSEVVSAQIKALITELLPALNSAQKESGADKKVYVTDSLEGLEDEKQSSEIIATLYSKTEGNHPSRIRPFYTEVEKFFELPLSRLHKERVADLPNKGDGKFPYRKMDTAIQLIGYKKLHDFAKSYEFQTK
ncbi:hypothetical protein MKX29_24340 [Cytobacillus sp. FSL R7-0696]|uniref:hypothetical protein n=1 Tax=Cytobacillus sp. FSL R7-0696 TaxID=2921691 RepID=UPI0030F6EBB7